MRPDPNGLFAVDESVTLIKSVRTPMQRQRDLDGTPHTITGPTALRPPDPELVIEGLSKACSEASPAPAPLDVDAVIKAFLES